jgi:hypothetical protein
MKPPEPLHPASTEAIAESADETGAEVLRGALCYPSESGGWQLGDIDFSEYLAQHMDPITSLLCTSQHSVCYPPPFFLTSSAC